MTKPTHPQKADLDVDEKNHQLLCRGAWSLHQVSALDESLPLLVWPTTDNLIINGAQLTEFDTVGALVLTKIIALLEDQKTKTTLEGFSSQQRALLKLIQDKRAQQEKPAPPPRKNFLSDLGKTTIAMAQEARQLLAFLGELTLVALRTLRKPSVMQVQSTISTVEITGLRALPIIGLLSFMIGVVLAYQMGIQLRSYGANIYIVDLLGLSVLREFAPLITAIIVAGRTSSAFTAELGMMKVNEELDALRTMGEAPTALLALPKLLGLVISLPLLIVWSDIFGVLGGMVMSKSMLGISYYDFLHRFQQNIALRHYFVGLSKAPAFALIVACVGCFLGFQVSGGADSVGRQTTKSVVLAIFLIIVADAGFSILFSWQNL